MEKQLQIIIRESALIDLEKECKYLAENYSVDYAEKFRLAFFEEIKTILPHPVIYPECRFLKTKGRIYRNIIWGNYLIIYKIKGHHIEILVLFHTKQHPKKLKRARRMR